MNKWNAKRILDFRLKLDLSQKDFGARLGVTQVYISLLESGQKTPSMTLQKLLDCVKKEGR